MGIKRHQRELAPEPDLSELERWHNPAFRDRMLDALLNVAGLADASDPDPTALVNAVIANGGLPAIPLRRKASRVGAQIRTAQSAVVGIRRSGSNQWPLP